jgi:hypothetical protein
LSVEAGTTLAKSLNVVIPSEVRPSRTQPRDLVFSEGQHILEKQKEICDQLLPVRF